MTRISLILVAMTMGFVPSGRSHACCNAFPPQAATSNVMQFPGARGTLASPFVIPTDTLRITRRTCDGPTNTSFPADPDDVRTVVLVRAPDRPRAIVLRRGTTNGPCPPGSDAFTASCQTELAKLGTGGQADCFDVLNYTAQPSIVDIEFPDLPSSIPPRATSSRAAVAVLGKNDPATVCGQLAQAKSHCADAIAVQPGLLACVDQIGVPTNPTAPCTGGMLKHPVFPEATLLPLPNDIKHVCHQAVVGQSCDQSPADEFRYGVDQPGNVLLPMSWERSLKSCPAQSLRIYGEVRSPCNLRVPDNGPKPHQSKWLESYTFDGKPNVPPFEKKNPSHAGLNRFTGTTEEPLSILRFGTRYGMCSSSTTELCNHPDQCSNLGDTCDPICSNNAPCGTSQPCSGGGQCGRLHDFSPEYADGRWRVTRSPRPANSCVTPPNPPGFCESVPAKLCNGAPDCPNGDCTSYLFAVGDCEPRTAGTPAPSVLEATPANLPIVFRPLLEQLGIPRDATRLLVAASSDDALALIVPRALLLGEKAAQCSSLSMETVLVAASVSRCAGDDCPVTCPFLGAGALVPRLAVYGTRVRFLQLPEVAAAASGMFDAVGRFFRRIFGGAEKQSAEAAVFLRILDTATSAVSTVGEVVISDPRFDPFAVQQNGATELLAAGKGRCMTSDGRTLGIPSLCDPTRTDECPVWATCAPADVVILMDLSLAL
jgi:hypothetical protein